MKFKFLFFTIVGFLFSQYDWQDNGVSVRQGIHIEWQRTGDNEELYLQMPDQNLIKYHQKDYQVQL